MIYQFKLNSQANVVIPYEKEYQDTVEKATNKFLFGQADGIVTIFQIDQYK